MYQKPSLLTQALKIGFALFIVVISLPLFTQNQPWLFIDGVNLLFHEAGHLIFGLLGEWFGRFGGTLMQLLIPTLTLIVFLKQKSWFSASFSSWWLGENLVNIAVYIKDASSRALPLVGNGDHDWYWLLSASNLLPADQLIGTAVQYLGRLIIVVAVMGLFAIPAVELVFKHPRHL